MSLIENVVAQPRRAGARSAYRDYLKRSLDVLVVVALAPIWLTVVLLLAVLVARGGGPAFFGHVRVGRNGRLFRCWKIRTMVPDAEAVLRRHLAMNPAAAEEWNTHFKLTDDPRVTPMGAFLRATSLDELPQLWNVLCGQMSLVGPRPVTVQELERFQGLEDAYLLVRPGLTGLWQVSGRNEMPYRERVQLEVSYAQTCSFRLDLMVLAQTFGAVLRRTGR